MPEWLHKSFPLKPGFGKLDIYLGAKLHKIGLLNGVWAWAVSPIKYLWESVRNIAVCKSFNYGGKYRMSKKEENPFKMGYDPLMDTSPELDPDTASYYLIIIGILRWMIKLGRTDIISMMSLLSSHTALPERDISSSNTCHVLCWSEIQIDHTVFKKCNWSKFYRNAKEAVPMNTQEPQGKKVDICMFVDSDHAVDKVSCRFRSGVVLRETIYRRNISFWCWVCGHEAGHIDALRS